MTLIHLLGLDSQSSREYMFWSGFGGDLVAIVITGAPVLWGVIMFYRHNKCHMCFRLGHHVPHIHYPVCKHHISTARSYLDEATADQLAQASLPQEQTA